MPQLPAFVQRDNETLVSGRGSFRGIEYSTAHRKNLQTLLTVLTNSEGRTLIIAKRKVSCIKGLKYFSM